MYLASYRFDGRPDELAAAYDRLMTVIPADDVLFHTAVTVDGGLLVIDACPTKEDFAAFSTSSEFAAAVEQAGLPHPIIEPLGPVHAVRVAHDLPVA
jgi:hypothetical protein